MENMCIGLIGLIGVSVVFAAEVEPVVLVPDDQASLTSSNAFIAPTVEPFQFSMWGGVGAWGGDVTYQIGGTVTLSDGTTEKVNDPLSELKWPLDVAVLTMGSRLVYQQRIELFADGMVSISDPSSKMEDSDWTESWAPGYKTIYSESDTELNAYAFDAGMRVWFINRQMETPGRLRFGLGAGLIYQYMDWKTTTTEQWTLGQYSEFSDAGTYNVKMVMPYVELAGEMQAKSFRLLAGIGLAPWVSAKDEDDHKLRYIKSTTDTTGYGIKGRLEGRFYFTKQFFMAGELRAMYYKTDGTEKDHIYAGDFAGETWEIDHEIESRQFSGVLGLGIEW